MRYGADAQKNRSVDTQRNLKGFLCPKKYKVFFGNQKSTKLISQLTKIYSVNFLCFPPSEYGLALRHQLQTGGKFFRILETFKY